MPHPARQRVFALEIVQQLRAAGFEALWAGGCVRDELLGLVPKDYDVATSATPDQIRDLFGRRRTIPVGAAFGVMTVLGPRAAGQIEVATFRTDAPYSDGRHPDSVTFTDAQHDAARRDFTINGLFYDPIAEQVIDYVGGQQDIKRRIIRAIGDPRLRLHEDKLRMLRAVRFAATFDFTIDPATLAAIQQLAPEVTTVSAERIGMEIRRMLVDPNRARALELLRESHLLPQVLPEVAYVSPATFDKTVRILTALHEPSLPLALAAVLSAEQEPPMREDGSPVQISPSSVVEAVVLGPYALLFDDHGMWRFTPTSAQRIARRLRFTNKESDRAAWLLQHLPLIQRARELPWPQLQRIIIHDGAAELLSLHEAVAGPDDPALRYARERLAWPPERLNPPPLIDGAALIRHGLTPGPEFATLLETVRDAQLNGEISTPQEALAFADRLRTPPNPLP